MKPFQKEIAMTPEQTDARLEEFFASRKRGQVGFNVAPRYSGGSPAGVDVDTALRVAKSEVEEYESILAGEEGEEALMRARKLGISCIVEVRRELPKAWDVLDLITGERFERPMETDKERAGWK
jgi:hypothetical protein